MKRYKHTQLRNFVVLSLALSSVSFALAQGVPRIEKKPPSLGFDMPQRQGGFPLGSSALDPQAISRQSIEEGLRWLDWRAQVRTQTGNWMSLEATKEHLRMGSGFSTPGVIDWRAGERGSVIANTVDARICMWIQKELLALPVAHDMYPARDLPRAGCTPDGEQYTIYFTQPETLLVQWGEIPDPLSEVEGERP